MPKTKKEFVSLLAAKMGVTENVASKWVEAYTETLIDIFESKEGVTNDGLGGLYLDQRETGCVFKLHPSLKIRGILGWS